MRKKLILIDLDDTLWDTRGNNTKSLYELYTALNWGQYFVSFEDFFDTYYEPINLELWGLYNQEKITKEQLSIERLRRPLSGLVEKSDTEWLEINGLFMELVRQKRNLCPNALPTLAYLHSRYRICILSNGFGEVQYSKMSTTGLMPYIDDIVLSDEVGYNKPNPALFRYALNLSGAKTAESIMIGDSWMSDIIGASNAGIDSIWYSPDGYGIEGNLSGVTPPKHIIRDLVELQTLL